jgi:ABC-type multidrug transport system ATPase subunit
MNIEVENLGKRFNSEWIFKKLTFIFESGKTYAIVGPNGCGKSTLLQVLWGQMPQSSGSIEYKSIDREIAIGDIFNHISIATPYLELIEEFTLIEMIEFHFKFKKLRNGLSKYDFLELLELEKAKNKTLDKFSSGMRQRLKLGLAFYSEANMVFLDEPTTNLDKASMEWYLKNLRNVPKNTLVLIASNQEKEYPSDVERIEILKYK